MHDYCRSTCPLLSLFFFLVFFIECDPEMYTVGGCLVSTSVTAQAVMCTTIDFWFGLEHPSDANWCVPQLTSDSVSNTHQMPSVVWSAKCPCRSKTCLVYNLLSLSGRSFCFPAHTAHATPVEPSAMLSPRWVYTLVSCSVRLIRIFWLINPGYLFIVVAPVRPVQDHFFYIYILS